MLGKTHKVGGLCTGVIASTLVFGSPITVEKATLCTPLVFGNIIGALFADIDLRGSTAGKKIGILSFIINKVCGHRGFTHTLIIPLITGFISTLLATKLSGLQLYVFTQLVFGFILGYLNHLLLDAMTIEGVPIFYPFTKKKFHILGLKTGKCEFFVRLILIIVTAIIVLKIL